MKNGLSNFFPNINDIRNGAIPWARKEGCRLKDGRKITAYEAVFYDGSQKIEAEFDGEGNLIEHEYEFVAKERFPPEVLVAFNNDFPNAQVVEYEIDIMMDKTVYYEFEVDGAKDKDMTYEMKNGKAIKAKNWCED